MSNITDINSKNKVGFKRPYLEDLPISGESRNTFLSEKLSGGLVLITGDCGCGKTTTATAAMMSRLRDFGGTAFMLEDPIEHKVAGRCGKNGMIFQFDADCELKEHVRKFSMPLNTNNGILYIGEMNSPPLMEHVLKQSQNGHLVLSTMVAASAGSAIKKIKSSLMVESGYSAEDALELINNSIKAVFHQKLVFNGQYEVIGEFCYPSD
jgi:twitching motility protein PilT